MKKKFIMSFVVLIILFSCSSENKDWIESQQKNNLESYFSFLQEYPNSEFSNEAKNRIDFLIDSIANLYLDNILINKPYTYKSISKDSIEICSLIETEVSKRLWNLYQEDNSCDYYMKLIHQFPESDYSKKVQQYHSNFEIMVNDFAPATLDFVEPKDKNLTYIFIKLIAKNDIVVQSGNSETYAMTYDGKTSPIIAYLHWDWEGLDINSTGMMRRVNGGSFIHTEFLKDYPGHPLTIVTSKGNHIYNFQKGGFIELGLFIDTTPQEIKYISLFCQDVKIPK